MKKSIIVIEGDIEDHRIVVRRYGRRVVVTATRPGIASSLERQIVEAFQASRDEGEKAIGFQMD